MPITFLSPGMKRNVASIHGNDAIRKHLCDLGFVEGAEVEVISDRDYTGSADIYGKPWDMVMDAIGECFPGLPASPYVVTGGTDARFFQEICPNCVRFAPVTFGPEQMHGMHGLNENLEIACLPGAVDFYKTLIRKNR